MISFVATADASENSWDGWRIDLTPYAWLPAVDADASAGGATVPIDMSLKDILDNFDVFALSSRIEAWHEEKEYGICKSNIKPPVAEKTKDLVKLMYVEAKNA